MFKKIINYSLICLMIICFINCSNKHYKWMEINKNDLTFNSYEKIINYKQLDSICNVDNLNSDYKTWYNMPYYDDETNEKVSEYVFIKEDNSLRRIIYILIPVDNMDNYYKITKRITFKQFYYK